MRKWLVEETGEVRLPKSGEVYFSEEFGINTAVFGWGTACVEEKPILRVTEIKDNPSPQKKKVRKEQIDG